MHRQGSHDLPDHPRLRAVRGETGQTMAEYAVLLGVIVIAVAGAFTVFATGVNQKLQSDIVTILSGM